MLNRCGKYAGSVQCADTDTDTVAFGAADGDGVVDIILKLVVFLCQVAGLRMIPQGSGKIVKIASRLTFREGLRMPSYTVSKSGIGGLTKLLANEWVRASRST